MSQILPYAYGPAGLGISCRRIIRSWPFYLKFLVTNFVLCIRLPFDYVLYRLCIVLSVFHPHHLSSPCMCSFWPVTAEGCVGVYLFLKSSHRVTLTVTTRWWVLYILKFRRSVISVLFHDVFEWQDLIKRYASNVTQYLVSVDALVTCVITCYLVFATKFPEVHAYVVVTRSFLAFKWFAVLCSLQTVVYLKD